MHQLLPPEKPAIWLPLDDSLITGPETHLRDSRTLLDSGILTYITAVLAFRGTLTAAHTPLLNTPTIMNLTASTTRGTHLQKTPVATVTDALRAGAQAVSCHLNLTSPYETEQLEHLGRTITEADTYGLPVIAFAYPRGRHPDGTDNNYNDLRTEDPEEFTALVRHCVRIAVDLGASAVKTVYSGRANFETVIAAAMGIPVLIAGGPVHDEWDDGRAAIDRAVSAVQAGAAGVIYGRQIFTRSEPVAFARELRGALR